MRQLEDDGKWLYNKYRMGWELPTPAPRWLRAPLIRRGRAVVYAWKVSRHQARWSGLGIPTRYDEWVVYAISRGWC